MRGVVDESNAAKAGLQRGDVLLSYAGTQAKDFDVLVTTLGEVSEAVAAGQRDADTPVPVTYWRDGRTEEAKLPPGKMGVQLDRGAPDSGLRLMAMRSRGHDQAVAEISATDQVRLHGGALQPLLGTEREALAITTLIEGTNGSATILLQEDATVGQLEAAANGKRILHLATHGLTGSSERPYDASLALTQPDTPTRDDIGFLTLDRLIARWRGKLSECELVVLSACDTQRGVKVGDSVMALPWGFFYAGAPTVVASLWKVDDTATALLMTRFYENLLGSYDKPREIGGRTFAAGSEIPKAAALREAKQWLRSLTADEAYELARQLPDDATRGSIRQRQTRVSSPETVHPYEHPYYWAAFILIGDPG